LLYEALIVLPEDQVLFDRFKVEQQQYLQRQEQVMALSRQNQLEDAIEVVNGEMNHLADTMAGTWANWSLSTRSAPIRRRHWPSKCSVNPG
jgi:methyl-accepting chemotaxis protein